ncbi:hypothetical protein AB0M29_07520 [Streptomyces sp. NPDC051976]|uniref:hypothetical protein n=1 Tax=Streptomyces sp. NPDC051976 TaxID=3154947 RepID=UPI00341B32A6
MRRSLVPPLVRPGRRRDTRDGSPLDPWATAAAMAVVVVAVGVAAAAGCAGAGGLRVDPADDGATATASVASAGHAIRGIPKGTVFTPYTAETGGFQVAVPQGWQHTERANYASFADRLDFVTVQWAKAAAAPTVDSVEKVEIPALKEHASVFTLQSVERVERPAGAGVEIDYLQGGGPDVVTGRTAVDSVQRYLFFHEGVLVTLTLAGPKGADDSRSWRTVTDSLFWLR